MHCFLFTLYYRNRRRSEINQSELQAIASQHSQEGEEQGEELGSSYHGNKGGVKEEDQRSLLSSCEDINKVEDERDRDGEASNRTVLHTYSVFMSNIGADEKCQVNNSPDNHHSDDLSLMERNCSTSEEEYCHINLKETSTDLVGNGEISSAVELPFDSSSSSSPEDGLRREVDTTAVRGREEVKLAQRARVKRGIKAALVDLKLFLW